MSIKDGIQFSPSSVFIIDYILSHQPYKKAPTVLKLKVLMYCLETYLSSSKLYTILQLLPWSANILASLINEAWHYCYVNVSNAIMLLWLK